METHATRPRIAVIEDNTGDFYLIGAAVDAQNLNAEIIHFSDGEEAIARLCRAQSGRIKPDLILLDLNLPRRSGFEVLAEIRKQGGLQDVPVAILTSSRSDQDRRNAGRQGATRYVPKPADLEAFRDVVGTTVRDLLSMGESLSA